jgi:hypothetical protein
VAELLADEDEIRGACKQHTITVTPVVSARGLSHSEPVEFFTDCSCGGLRMGGDPLGEALKLIQAHLRGHGVPVSQWWPRRHPDHPLEAGRG